LRVFGRMLGAQIHFAAPLAQLIGPDVGKYLIPPVHTAAGAIYAAPHRGSVGLGTFSRIGHRSLNRLIN